MGGFKMTQHTRIYGKFEYHTEDMNCIDCLHYKRKSKKHKTGCHEEFCRFDDVRNEAINYDRIKRKTE
jgi:hypothetical protein